MKDKEDDRKEPAERNQETKKVSPLGNLKKAPPTRDEKPHEEFIEQEPNSSKKQS